TLSHRGCVSGARSTARAEVRAGTLVRDVLTDVGIPFIDRQVAAGNAAGAPPPGCDVEVPQPDRPIAARGRQRLAVGAERNTGHRARRAAEGSSNALMRCKIPQDDGLLLAARGQRF